MGCEYRLYSDLLCWEETPSCQGSKKGQPHGLWLLLIGWKRRKRVSLERSQRYSRNEKLILEFFNQSPSHGSIFFFTYCSICRKNHLQKSHSVLSEKNLEKHCSHKQYIAAVFKVKLHLLDFKASYPKMGNTTWEEKLLHLGSKPVAQKSMPSVLNQNH